MATINKETKTVITITLTQEEALAVGAACRGFEEARDVMVRANKGASVHLKNEYRELPERVGRQIATAFDHKTNESVWDYAKLKGATNG